MPMEHPASSAEPPRDLDRLADAFFMKRALALAERGLYSADPNPRVGCVIVREGRIVGEGWHRRAGGPHAEVEALAACGEAARGATAFVTLEPCSHHGRTPPCADALLAAGVRRVVAAMADPSAAVNGRGLVRLREAGVEVVAGVCEAQARALNPGFVKRARKRLPWVRLKLATSLGGRTALANGASRWITGPAARGDVHHWRARSSAILTGAGTVRADHPRLDARADEIAPGRLQAHFEPIRQPSRVVLTRYPETLVDPTRGPAFTPDPRGGTGGEVLVISTPDQESVAGRLACHSMLLLTVSAGEGGVALRSALEALAARECNEVLAECGPRLAGALLRASLVDEILLYTAPCMLGSDARPLVVLTGIEKMDDRLRFDLRDVCRLGEDVRFTLTSRVPSGPSRPATRTTHERSAR